MTPIFYAKFAEWKVARDYAFGIMPRNGTITTTEHMQRWSDAHERMLALRAELSALARTT